MTRRHALLTSAAMALMPWLGRKAEAESFEVSHTDAEWRALLTPGRYAVLRQAATEKPYSNQLKGDSSPLLKENRAGTFHCAGCDLALFSSTTKFDSGTGWPSFYDALPGAVALKSDRSLLIARTEVLCHRCGGHLGHVFDDGPKPTGKRYCMNGLALTFSA